MFGLTVLLPAAHAVDFSGKRIEWIVPFKEGGGSSRWAHFLAPMLSENLPGKPAIAVKNIPGGGSTKGANQFALRAKPDGLTILGTSGSTQFPYLLGDKRVQDAGLPDGAGFSKRIAAECCRPAVADRITIQ